MRYYLLLLIVLCLVLVPLLLLILGSFSTAAFPTDFSLSTLGIINYVKVYSDPATYEVLFNTLVYVCGSVSLGISLSVCLAWLVERTNVPWKVLIYAGVPMTIAIPSMLQAMAWVLLFSPRIGFVNAICNQVFGLDTPLFNIYSLEGMILVEGLRLVPAGFLMLVPLLRAMDPALEEAAAAAGALPVSIIRRITLPLLMPGLLAVVIYQGMSALEGFEIPGILGFPAKINVFSTRVYLIAQSVTFPPPYGEANALAMFYLLIAVTVTFLYLRVIGQTHKYTVVTGKGYRPRPINLGVWRVPALGFALLFLFLSILLPFGVLLYMSLLPYIQSPSIEAIGTLTFKNYRSLTIDVNLYVILKNTFTMVVVTATIATLLSFFISLVVVRSTFWGRKLLDQLAFISHAIPGIVMGLAFFWVLLKIDFLPIYGTIWAISLAFIPQFLPFGTRSMNAALLQIHKELEEAAYVSGASQTRALMDIAFPLLLPTFVGIWIWIVLIAIRAAGTPLMLYQGVENQVLSILIWNMWDSGQMGQAAAIGCLLISFLMFLTVIIRYFGFRRVE
jgi:iron(III) transport system permease protein